MTRTVMSPSAARRIFTVVFVLLAASQVIPPDRWQIPLKQVQLGAQVLLSSGALFLAVVLARGTQAGARPMLMAMPVQLTLCAVAGTAVQALAVKVPLVPIAFFLAFPFSTFARRFPLFWVPGAMLSSAALGRYLIQADTALLPWAILFWAFSLPLGFRMSRDRATIMSNRAQFERMKSDAREMMGRIRKEGFPEMMDRIRGEEAALAAALEEDDFLQKLLVWGCRAFGARTGVLLVPDRPGYVRMRAAVHRGVRITGDMVPADKGFVHIARQRGGVLCVSDARSARSSLGFYSEDVEVGSFLVKVVYESNWAEDAVGEGRAEKVRCVLYFDSASVGALELDDVTSRRLEEYGGLVSKAMEMAFTLHRVTADLSAKDAISKYARSLTQSLDRVKIAEKALDAVVEALPDCDGAVVLLNDGGLSVAGSRGEAVRELGAEKILRDEPSQIGLLLRRFSELEADAEGGAVRAEVVVGYAKELPSPFFHRREKLGRVVSFAAIPCFIRDQAGKPDLQAVISVVSRSSEAFGREEMEDLRTLAGMMAPALDNARLHSELNELSRIDGLTGLLNRRIFDVILDGKISHVRRGNFQRLAVLMIDGDRFKTINDTYGHKVGDEVLVELGRRLKPMVRKNDAVARYGGEEFAIVLDNAGRKQARDVAEKIRRAIRSAPVKTSAGPIPVTVSLGFSVLEKDEKITRSLIVEQADQALYQAKEKGRDRVVGYHEIAHRPAGDEDTVTMMTLP
ncbi:MAG: GGDEF domain-containing protein [bacterium]|nr:MAG: GGDEF domain-containing protein [bacterium]